MRYTIRHITRFGYDVAVSESVVETRMQPRSDGSQRCLQFKLTTSPNSRVLMYQDHDGNIVHHFGVTGKHSRLTVTADALVETGPAPLIPYDLGRGAWERLSELTAPGEDREFLNPSQYIVESPLLTALSEDIALDARADPLALLRRLTTEVYDRFEYTPQSTRVDSPIDEALKNRRGVCQDFSHIMIAMVRKLGIPCRYVSGYLFHQDHADRSSAAATHAWVEALLPDLGWVGFDPTNNMLAEDRHVRVAIGRDYCDVPPTRGVFKGVSVVKTDLSVAVRVGSTPQTAGEPFPFVPWMSRDGSSPPLDSEP